MKILVTISCMVILSSCAMLSTNKTWKGISEKTWISDADSTVYLTLGKNSISFTGDGATDVYSISKIKKQYLSSSAHSALKIFVFKKSVSTGYKKTGFFIVDLYSDDYMILTDEKESSHGFHIKN